MVKQFDYQSPSANALLGARLTDRLIATGYYQYQYNLLRGQTFGNVNLLGTNAIYALNERWLLQSGFQYSQATFQAVPGFTSSNLLGRVVALRFLSNDRTSYLMGGYTYGKSNAAVNAYSYNANTVYLGGRWLLGPSRRNDILLLGSLGLYNFDHPDVVQTTTVRNDHNAAFSGRYARWFTPRFNLFTQYTLFNNNSNIVRQDFNSSIMSVGGTWIR